MIMRSVCTVIAATVALSAPPALADQGRQIRDGGPVQLAQQRVSRGALLRWCATVPTRFRTAIFEQRCAALRQATRGDLREWCNRMPLHWQSQRMQRRCAFIVGGRRGDGGPGVGGPGVGGDDGSGRLGIGRCNVRRVTLTVRSRGCAGQSRRLNFRKSFLRPGESLIGRLNSGVIGKGRPPFGVCNFHTRIRYRCVRGRVRIVNVFECRQNRSGPTGASCSLSYR